MESRIWTYTTTFNIIIAFLTFKKYAQYRDYKRIIILVVGCWVVYQQSAVNKTVNTTLNEPTVWEGFLLGEYHVWFIGHDEDQTGKQRNKQHSRFVYQKLSVNIQWNKQHSRIVYQKLKLSVNIQWNKQHSRFVYQKLSTKFYLDYELVARRCRCVCV